MALAAEPAGFVAGVALLAGPFAGLRRRSRALTWAVAGLSAAGAALTGASATGWLPLDILLLAALGAGATLAGSVAGTRLLVALSVAAAAFGIGSAALPIALAGCGVLLAGLVDEEPLLNATGAALVAQAVLRLERPGGDGMTALVAGALLLPLCVAGIVALDRRARSQVVRAAIVLAAFCAVAGVASGVAAWRAAGPLRNGLALASTVVSADPQTGLDASAATLTSARKDFETARRALGAWWVRPAAAVPVVAQHWRVLHAAAISGDQLASAGEQALGAPALADVRVVDGRIPLDQLAAIRPAVGRLAHDLAAAQQRLGDARSPLLLPPLLDRFDDEMERVVRAGRTTRNLDRALAVLPGLLGGDGPRRYFVAVQTAAEARAGGGYIGNYAELTADAGQLSLSRFGRPSELNDAPGRNERQLVAPPDFVERYSRFAPEFQWENINLSPDFPTDAGVIAGLYPQSGGSPVDGVIAVDPAGLAAFLRLVGPVTVAGWPVPITADNAAQIMLHEQYVLADRVERIDFLGDVAQQTWARVSGGELPPPQQLLSTLSPVVREKHLLLSSTHPEEQRLFDEIGASGRMAPIQGDFIGLVTQNAGANKIDYFLRRSVDYQAEVNTSNRRLQATATVTLHNDAPAGGLPGSVIGNQIIPPPLPDGSNKMYLSFYTPWDLVEARLDGQPVQLEEATELGRRVYSTGLVVPPKGSIMLELRLSGRLPDVDTYRLDVYRQPVVAPDEVTTALRLGNGAGEPVTRQLSADEVVLLPLGGR